MGNKILTIIIPAYNMEKYLHRCLDSILVENLMNLVQIIVVNDGSRDMTSEIAHRYEQQYPRYIQVIDKENGNYGSCMNVGLSLAEGKYFRTLDADDWYDSSAFVSFVEDLKNTDSDMVVSEHSVCYEDSDRHIVQRFDNTIDQCQDILIKKDIWKSNAVLSNIHVYCITYKTSVLKESGLKWSEDVYYTDNEFLYWPLKYVKTIRFAPFPVYNYLIGREGQSVSIHSLKRSFHSYNVVTNKVLDHYLKSVHKNETDPLAKFLLLKLLCRFYNTLMYNGLQNKDAVKSLDAKLKEDKELYKESSRITDFRGHFFINYFRNNMFYFFLFRLDYLVRSNYILRRLFKKDY